ncbi:MAG TPA: zinc-binding dehydrogenase, partial [Gaiellaceae bacterium]|nr:zinc-binding dehydrogenase [Gaiellaceae bacterium]
MRAAVLRAVGEPLEPADVPEPAGDGVVEVRAAGVNFADVLIRRGAYPQMPELPYVPGSEVAGDLDGRRVVALTRGGGGYAERAAVQSEWTFPLPDGASYEEGAGFLLTFLTAYIPLVRQLRIGPHSTVLVHAASGGVGSAAVQLCRFAGARVFGTASSAEKRDVVRDLGAEPRGYDELDDVRVDVVLDPVGGDIFTRSLKLLEPLGSIVAIGYAAGAWEPLDPALVVGRNIAVHGLYLGRLMQRTPELVHEAAHELVALWARGELRPLVGSTFPLDQAEQALGLIEQ